MVQQKDTENTEYVSNKEFVGKMRKKDTYNKKEAVKISNSYNKEGRLGKLHTDKTD